MKNAKTICRAGIIRALIDAIREKGEDLSWAESETDLKNIIAGKLGDIGARLNNCAETMRIYGKKTEARILEVIAESISPEDLR